MRRPAFTGVLAGLVHSAVFATWFVSCYLAVYTIFLWSGVAILGQIAFGMFLTSPLFVLWLVYAVIRHGGPAPRELDPGEEFGYADRRQ
ncbi:MAG TPA: hypothetical protein VHI52_02510 [Verrucomicrobiae bacterium]|nr:hypothetical protein [Verrucomicrobiae bacterium]